MSNIKLGVTLYSFSTEYCNNTMDLEDMIRTSKELGAEGIEIVATQMIPSYPSVDDDFIGKITALCHKYKVELVCYGANMDRGMRKDRSLSDDEMLQMAINDVKNASKLGCKVIREQNLLPADVLVKLAPYAEAYDVKVGIEIHNPNTPITPGTLEYLKAIKESGSKYIGFVVDFGCFAVKPNKMNWDNALAEGANITLLEQARDLKYAEVPQAEAYDQLVNAGASAVELAVLRDMYGFLQFKKDISKELEGLKEILPYTFHMHGKFHYMYESLEEASIPYDQIMSVINESDYEGYIVSENEEYNAGRTKHMLGLHLQMMKKLKK